MPDAVCAALASAAATSPRLVSIGKLWPWYVCVVVTYSPPAATAWSIVTTGFFSPE